MKREPISQPELIRFAGAETFARGQRYAEDGSVLSYEWSPTDGRLEGFVQGNARHPYWTTVDVVSYRGGHAMRSVCTCPVGDSCKHAVALVLAAQNDAVSSLPESANVENAVWSLPVWERQLRGLAQEPSGTSGAHDPEIALQFEVGRPTDEPTIRVRPVVRGRHAWTRTGISWATIENLAYRNASTLTLARVEALKELLALSRTGLRSYLAYSVDVVTLESVRSRRLWDLLNELGNLGVPFFSSGRVETPVRVEEGVIASLDVSQVKEGTRVALRLDSAGVDVSQHEHLFVGAPPHGVVWWSDANSDSSGATSIRLAPLTGLESLDPDRLPHGAILVPTTAQSRLLDEVIPLVRRHIAITSRDGSVPIPDVKPTQLVVSIRRDTSQSLTLSWRWSVDGGAWTEPLTSSRAEGPDARVRADLTDRVRDVVREFPELFVDEDQSSALATTSRLATLSLVRFLDGALPILQNTDGIVVEILDALPAYREALAPPVVSLQESTPDDRDWFDLHVSLSVDGEDVPFASVFVALASGESHLILPSGTYFSLDRPELRKLSQMIVESAELDNAPPGTLRVTRFATSAWDDLVRLGVVLTQATRWEATVRSLATLADTSTREVPATVSAKLRPYQRDGFNWLASLYDAGLGGILADDMGLGKTLQALALMAHVRERDPSSGPFLVVAPTSVVGNWVSECRRFTPSLRVTSITQTSKRRATSVADLAADADVVVTSYAIARLDLDECQDVSWAGAIFDEGQFAKNRQSATYLAVRQLRCTVKFVMTGTPIENNLMELWSLLSICAPGLFPSPQRFDAYFRGPIERRGDQERLHQLRRRIGPLMLRRTKELVAKELPKKQEQVLELELAPGHRKVYDTYLQRERKKILGLLSDVERNRFEILKSLTILRQASLDVSLVDARHTKVPSTKLDALMEMIEEIVADGHRVLVFSQFTTYLSIVRARMKKAGVAVSYLDGKTRKRDVVIDQFRSGATPVFLISLKAGGFGLNLVEADYCFILDPWWNPATEAQAVDRAHRIGQTRKVMVYRLVAKDTIEEKVMTLKGRKQALFSSVLDGDTFASPRLTASDIRQLLE